MQTLIDPENADISPRIKALLAIAGKVQKGELFVQSADIKLVRNQRIKRATTKLENDLRSLVIVNPQDPSDGL